MNIKGKYHNYDLHPCTAVEGFERQAWAGAKNISEQFISNLNNVDVNEFDQYISELERRIKGKGDNGTLKLRLPIDVKGTLSDEAIYNVKDIKTLIDTAKSAKQTRIDSEKNKTTYKEDYDKDRIREKI